MLPHRQSSPFRERDICYSNLFLGTTMLPQRQIFPFRDREVFIRIFSRHHYAATQAELPFQGVRRLLFKSFPSTTRLPQRQNSLFRDRDIRYSNLFHAPLCGHKGRVPSFREGDVVIQIISKHHNAVTNTEFTFQGRYVC